MARRWSLAGSVAERVAGDRPSPPDRASSAHHERERPGGGPLSTRSRRGDRRRYGSGDTSRYAGRAAAPPFVGRARLPGATTHAALHVTGSIAAVHIEIPSSPLSGRRGRRLPAPRIGLDRSRTGVSTPVRDRSSNGCRGTGLVVTPRCFPGGPWVDGPLRNSRRDSNR